MASIARKNLLTDIPRFLVAQAGIMFAVSLVTIQTGLQSGFSRSSTLLIDQSKAALWVGSEHMVHMDLTLPIPYETVTKAQKVQGVDRAEPLIIKGGLWRDKNDNISSISIIGSAPKGQLFSPWNITQGTLNDLNKPYTVMADKNILENLNIKQVGDTGKIGNYGAKLVGLTEGTKSLVMGNLVFTSLETANTYLNSAANARVPCDLAPWEENCISDNENESDPPAKKLAANDLITYVLVKAKPGEDIAALQKRLADALPDTRAYTRDEIAKITREYWQERSGIGFILGLGAVVGVIVGIVIVGQILYSSVSDHIKEFGTLKAMGASDWVIYSVIIEQALWMSILGYVPGIALCLGVATWTSATQGILILITPVSAVVVLGITVTMCVISATFAIQKVTRIDPAIVFKA